MSYIIREREGHKYLQSREGWTFHDDPISAVWWGDENEAQEHAETSPCAVDVIEWLPEATRPVVTVRTIQLEAQPDRVRLEMRLSESGYEHVREGLAVLMAQRWILDPDVEQELRIVLGQMTPEARAAQASSVEAAVERIFNDSNTPHLD